MKLFRCFSSNPNTEWPDVLLDIELFKFDHVKVGFIQEKKGYVIQVIDENGQRLTELHNEELFTRERIAAILNAFGIDIVEAAKFAQEVRFLNI